MFTIIAKKPFRSSPSKSRQSPRHLDQAILQALHSKKHENNGNSEEEEKKEEEEAVSEIKIASTGSSRVNNNQMETVVSNRRASDSAAHHHSGNREEAEELSSIASSGIDSLSYAELRAGVTREKILKKKKKEEEVQTKESKEKEGIGKGSRLPVIPSLSPEVKRTKSILSSKQEEEDEMKTTKKKTKKKKVKGLKSDSRRCSNTDISSIPSSCSRDLEDSSHQRTHKDDPLEEMLLREKKNRENQVKKNSSGELGIKCPPLTSSPSPVHQNRKQHRPPTHSPMGSPPRLHAATSSPKNINSKASSRRVDVNHHDSHNSYDKKNDLDDDRDGKKVEGNMKRDNFHTPKRGPQKKEEALAERRGIIGDKKVTVAPVDYHDANMTAEKISTGVDDAYDGDEDDLKALEEIRALHPEQFEQLVATVAASGGQDTDECDLTSPKFVRRLVRTHHEQTLREAKRRQEVHARLLVLEKERERRLQEEAAQAREEFKVKLREDQLQREQQSSYYDRLYAEAKMEELERRMRQWGGSDDNDSEEDESWRELLELPVGSSD